MTKAEARVDVRLPGAGAAVATLALHVFREQVRNRAWLLILGFGAVMLYASLLLGVLAVDEELRVLLDMGLALIELTALEGRKRLGDEPIQSVVSF